MRMTGMQFERFAPRARGWIMAGMVDQAPALLVKYGIDTSLRIAHFMAQIAHESDGFNTFEEYASGAAYEGRKDLGNTKRGDGRKFKGRGPIQVTGRANYRELTKWLRLREPDCPDFEEAPKLLGKFPYGLIGALWYWDTRGLNRYADKNDLRKITKRINGGYNGLTDRKAWFQKAWRVWGKEEVEHANHGKPMVKSVTVGATVAKTTASLASVAVATDQITGVRDAVKDLVGEGWTPSNGAVFWVMVAAILGLAGWIIYTRWRKSVEYSI